jgi:PAS domain S-box-containing protein
VRHLGLFICLLASAAHADTTLRVGVLKLRSAELTLKQWEPTFTRLEDKLPSVDFEVEALDYAQLDERIRAGSLDVVVTNPEHYLLRRALGLRAIATVMPLLNGRPTTQFSGVIFTRADSTISTLEEVSTARTAAVSEMAVAAYLTQRWELVKVGLDVSPRTEFVGADQDEVVLRVLDGRAEVGFVRTGVLEAMAGDGLLDLARVRVINEHHDRDFPLPHSTELVPEWPVVVTADVASEQATQLQRALLDVENDSVAAHEGRYFGFAPPVDYAPVEALLLRLATVSRGPRFGLADVLARYSVPLLSGVLALLAAAMVVVVRLWRDKRRLDGAAHEKAQLLSSLGEGVVGVDEHGVTTYVNDAALKLLGYQREQVIGQNLHALVHHHTVDQRALPEPECDIFHSLRDGRARAGESWFFRADGSTLPAWRSVVPVREGARITGAVVTFVDQTERHAADAELKRSRDLAEAANAAKSRFLATMSHEIRTPLNGVLGMAQLLVAPKLSDAERLDYAQTIIESGGSLLQILNDILDLAKVEAGRLELSPAPMSPATIVSEMQTLFGHVARLKGVTLTARFEGDRELLVRADAVRLRQMMANLVGNAVKFTEQGNVELVTTLRLDGHLRCELRDTGPGIPADKLGALFLPFSQLDSSDTRRVGGTGLGLSIVRELAEAMGGRTGVSSVPGEGSCFWFVVALEPCSQAEQAASLTPEALTLDVPRRVLVVEDNAINRRVIEGLLKRLGCATVSVENGLRALEAIGSGATFDVVLMDCQMPELDGFEATRQLREREARLDRPRLRVVALTAAAFEDDRKRCLDAGMDDFMTKPISLANLVRVLSASPVHRPTLVVPAAELPQ